LKSVVTPGLAHHHFGRLIAPGTDRNIYWPPTTKSISGTIAPVSRDPVAFDYDGAGRHIRTSYASGRRRVVYRYGSLGHLSVLAFDQTDVEYHYNPESMKLDKIQMTDLVSGNRSSVLEYANSSEALITSHNVSSYVDVTLSPAYFRYEYDAHFRTSSVSVTIGDIRLPSSVYRYRIETGLLEQMSGFQFQAETMQNGQRIVIRDSNIQMSRELDGFGRQTDVLYTFNNYIVFTLEVRSSVNSHFLVDDVDFKCNFALFAVPLVTFFKRHSMLRSKDLVLGYAVDRSSQVCNFAFSAR
jgi:hypothetical protein